VGVRPGTASCRYLFPLLYRQVLARPRDPVSAQDASRKFNMLHNIEELPGAIRPWMNLPHPFQGKRNKDQMRPPLAPAPPSTPRGTASPSDAQGSSA